MVDSALRNTGTVTIGTNGYSVFESTDDGVNICVDDDVAVSVIYPLAVSSLSFGGSVSTTRSLISGLLVSGPTVTPWSLSRAVHA